MIAQPAPPVPRDPAGPLAALRRRDDLLALLYWLHADQLNQMPTAAELSPFSGSSAALDADLVSLVEAGLVAFEAADPPELRDRRLRLTPAGLAEARRRFEEEFSPVLADGIAGNAHEVMVGVCGPNAKCVKEGLHGECLEPVLPPTGGS